VSNACKTIRSPGGESTDAAGNTVRNNRLTIPTLAEHRFCWVVYLAHYFEMIGLPIVEDTMRWSHIKHFVHLKSINDNHVSPDTLANPSQKLNIMKRIELLKEHLSSVLGVRKVPLIYVLCKKVAVENIVNAPLPAIATSNLSYAAKYDSFHEEMIGCSSHDHPTYSADNKHVFTIINEALADTIYATSVKPHSRKKNGRAAYKSLVSHNCGNSKWETVSEVTERKVTRSEWNGQSNCFTLVKHIQNHCAAHNDMLRSSEFVNYEVPNDCTRVTSLLLSITSTDPRGVSAKTSILADGLSKRNDFELTADFLLKAAPDKNPAPRAQNIYSLKSNWGGVDLIRTKGMERGETISLEKTVIYVIENLTQGLTSIIILMLNIKN